MDYGKIKDLVVKVQSGEKGAMNDLFTYCWDDLYKFAVSTIKDEHLAQDIAQNSSIIIMNTIGSLREPEAFPVWAERIVYHECTKYFKEKETISLDDEEEGLADRITDIDTSVIPEQVIEDKEYQKTLMDIVNELPPEQRSAIILHIYKGRSVAEIAQIENVPEGTIKSRLNYGKKKLEVSITEYEKKTGIKLHGLVLLALLFYVIYKAQNSIKVPSLPFDIFSSVTAAQGGTVAMSATTTAVVSGGMSIFSKIAIGVAAAAAIAAATFGIISLVKNNQDGNKPVLPTDGPDIVDTISTENTEYETSLTEVTEVTETPTEIYIDPETCEHTFVSETTPSTCIEKGHISYICERCHYSYVEEITDLSDHSFSEWTVTKEATCESEGEMERVCSVCGLKETEIIETIPHSFGEYEITKEATCDEDGQKSRQCSLCGLTETEDIKAKGHSYGSWETTKVASCASAGEEQRICSVCGRSEKRTVNGGSHIWDSGVSRHNDQNCADEIVYTCNVCGQKKSQVTGYTHSFNDTSNQYVVRWSCKNCYMYYVDYYEQFEDMFSSKDPNAALYTDKVHITNYPTSLRTDWSPRWKEFERIVKNSIKTYLGSNKSNDEGMGGLSPLKGETEADLYKDYDKFRKEFAKLYGWTPVDVEFADNDAEVFVFSDAKAMYNAFKNAAKNMSSSQKTEITNNLIQELLYDCCIHDGMQLYNAVGRLYDVITTNVGYDWSLGYHSAFYGLCCGSTVCDGYSEIFQKCCDFLGIKCKTIIGTYNGEGHAWNMVTFSDGTERFSDLTMNDRDYRVLFPKDALDNYKF